MNRKDVERLHESAGSEHLADALSLTRDEEAARDIVQNLFTGLLAPGVQPEDPEACIAVAVRNGVLKWRGREAQERQKRALQEPIWVAPDELSERVAALEAALAKLSFDQQQVMQMYFRQGLKKLARPCSREPFRHSAAVHRCRASCAE